MPKYKVTLIDKVYYEICVEAEDEDKAEEFDKQFPPKEKLKLPGQLF